MAVVPHFQLIGAQVRALSASHCWLMPADWCLPSSDRCCSVDPLSLSLTRLQPPALKLSAGEHASRWPGRPFGAHLTTVNYHCLLSFPLSVHSRTLSPYILPLFAHILSPLSVSAVKCTLSTDTVLYNFALTSVVCAFPERCLLTSWTLFAHTLSALSPSIAVNPPALSRTSSACPSQSLSWTLSARFLNCYLRTYSCCLRTTLPHWHSSLTQLTHNALTQLTHSALNTAHSRCTLQEYPIQDERQLALDVHCLTAVCTHPLFC